MKVAGYCKFRQGPSLTVEVPEPDLLPCEHAKVAKAWGTHVCTRRGPGTEKTCACPQVCIFYTRPNKVR